MDPNLERMLEVCNVRDSRAIQKTITQGKHYLYHIHGHETKAARKEFKQFIKTAEAAHRATTTPS